MHIEFYVGGVIAGNKRGSRESKTGKKGKSTEAHIMELVLVCSWGSVPRRTL